MSSGEAGAIDVAEFEALRQEINSRLNVSYSLLALEVAALGAGISIAVRFPQALGGLALVSSLLWLFWTDNSVQVQRLGAYIALDLGPRLNQGKERPVLRWEAFMRRLAKGGQEAADLLFGEAPRDGREIRSAIGSDWYTAALFGGTSPVLIVLYAFSNSLDGAGEWLLLASASTATMVLWGYGVLCFTKFTRLQQAVADAIAQREGFLRRTPSPSPSIEATAGSSNERV